MERVSKRVFSCGEGAGPRSAFSAAVKRVSPLRRSAAARGSGFISDWVLVGVFEQLPCRWFFLAEKASFGVEERVDFLEERARVGGEGDQGGVFGRRRFWEWVVGGGEQEDGEVCEVWEGADAGEEGIEVEGWGGGVEEEQVRRTLFGEAECEVGLVGRGDIVGGASGENAFEGADARGVGVENDDEEGRMGGGWVERVELANFGWGSGFGGWDEGGVSFGEGDGECGADVLFALDGDGAIHGFEEAFGEGKADSGSFDALGFGIESVEGGEDAVHFGFGDAEAGVTDGDADGFCFGVVLGGDGDVAFGTVVLDGV